MIQGFLQRLADRLDIPGYPWKTIAVGMVVVDFGIESYLRYRQYQVLKEEKVPEALSLEVSESTYRESQVYLRKRSQFGFVQSIFNTLENCATLQFNVYPVLWSFSGSLLRSFAPSFAGTVSQTMVFAGVSSVIQTVLHAPFSLYRNFVLEEEFGFNNMSLGLWAKDTIKSVILSLVLFNPIIASLVKVIESTGPSFFYYAWGFVVAMSLVMITVYPSWIAPLFNKFTLIEESSELGRQMRGLCNREDVEFPVDKLFQIDGSTRSSHGNAYFTGLPWKKQIVVYDTLLKGVFPNEKSDDEKKRAEVDQGRMNEVLGVLGHEIGHWKLNHIAKSFALNQSLIFLTFASFSAFIRNNSLYTSFGFPSGEMPIYIGLSLFLTISSLVSTLTSLGFNCLSQKAEHEADEFAVKLGYKEDIGRALIRLNIDSLGSLHADWLYSLFNNSHPILTERLTKIGWVSGEEPVVSEQEQLRMREEKLAKKAKAEHKADEPDLKLGLKDDAGVSSGVRQEDSSNTLLNRSHPVGSEQGQSDANE